MVIKSKKNKRGKIMAIEFTENDEVRTYTDNFSGRECKEYKCAGCGEWIVQDEVIWATPDGKLTMQDPEAQAWCEDCLPAENK